MTASLGDEKRETRNINRVENLLVMEAFDLPYDKGKDHQFLHVEVNHNLGVARFPVNELPSPHEDDGAAAAMWLSLLVGEKAVGKVRIAAKLAYVAGLDPGHQDLAFDDSQDTQHPNEIRVAVCRARDLHPAHSRCTNGLLRRLRFLATERPPISNASHADGPEDDASGLQRDLRLRVPRRRQSGN